VKPRRSYQQKLIRNYYENRDNIMMQSLSETVSELYLCGNDRRRGQLWKRAETAMKNMGVKPPEIERILKAHDLTALAALVSQKF